jgi:hypothetical protein
LECVSARAISHAGPANRTQSSLTEFAPVQSPCSLNHVAVICLHGLGDRFTLVIPCTRLISQLLDQLTQEGHFSAFDLPKPSDCSFLPCASPGSPSCPAGADSASGALGGSCSCSFLTIACIFRLQGVVFSLAIREVLSPFLQLRRERILRTVTSLGSRRIHVCLRAECPLSAFVWSGPLTYELL